MNRITGKKNYYHWLETTEISLYELTTRCPELLTGKTVAITSFDSDPLSPSKKDVEFGWYAKDDVFYAPCIVDPLELPYDQYDEWYIFDDLKEFKPMDLFVNYGSFSLRDPTEFYADYPDLKERDNQEILNFQIRLLQKFWDHINRIRPRSFILDGDRFIFGSRSSDDFSIIKSLFI